uniref:Uncharacterized protein n=1 Tax=Panagrolaimus sp. JU765 TaxID=591449 RepID=A0AC34R6L0_9BILA
MYNAFEINYHTTFTSPDFFAKEIEKAKTKYTIFLKKKGVKEDKLPSRPIVKLLDTRKVLSRMTLVSIVLGTVLDTFELELDNPVIFLAPPSFLILLLIRKDVSRSKINDV